MERAELRQFIEENLITPKGKFNPWAAKKDWMSKKGWGEYFEAFFSHTVFLNPDIIFMGRIHCIRNGITKPPACGVCGGSTNYFKEYKDFAKTCGNISCVLPETKEARKQTNIERHGIEYSFNTKEAQTKAHKATQTPEAQEKRRITNLERYDVDNPSKSNEIKKIISKKHKRDGVGRNHLQKQAFSDSVWNKINDPSFWWYEHLTCQKPIMAISKELGISVVVGCNWYHKTTGELPKNFVGSYSERELQVFIESFYDKKVSYNDRSILKKELDVYIPGIQTAIEFNGLYWHREQICDASYHLSKTSECLDRGIHLLHIFEDEWNNKRDIWESIIKHKFGLTENIVYGRKCKIQEIQDHRITREFLLKNHLQSYTNQKQISIGLFYNDTLVSIMTFGKPRYNKNYEWELVRFCNKINHSVIGAPQKLLKFFVKNFQPKNLISYADRRYSNGKMYEKLQMDMTCVSRPNYFYIDSRSVKRYSRIMFQKHKLSKILENFDPDLSERENMTAHGYNRIYDCGNLVFTKTFIA